MNDTGIPIGRLQNSGMPRVPIGNARGGHGAIMKNTWRWLGWLGVALLLGTGSAAGQERFDMDDTNFYVIGITDWNGNLAVEVMSYLDMIRAKEELDLDNEALKIAYQNLKQDWKTEHRKPTATDATPKVPPFPLKCPPRKEFRQLGKFPTQEPAEARKKEYADREAARVKRAEEQRGKPPVRLSEAQQDKAEEKAAAAEEEMEKLLAEIKDVKFDLMGGKDPSRDKEGESKKGGKTITVKQGARLGDNISGPLGRGGNLVNEGPLK